MLIKVVVVSCLQDFCFDNAIKSKVLIISPLTLLSVV